MIETLPKYILSFVLLVLLQVLLLNNINLTVLDISPFLYILFILILPFEVPRWLLLLSGFVLGLTVDIFSDSIGVHAFATVFLAFLRPHVINLIASRQGYEIGTQPRLYYYGFLWFLKYTIILTLFHHFAYFIIETFSFQNFHITLLKIVLSTFFSSVLIILSQYFIFRR